MDIALCDLYMEGMGGLEFLHRVARAGLVGLVGAVILCSSLSEDVRRAARQLVPLLGLELLGYVGKPLRIDTLEALLKEHLYKPAVTSANLKSFALAGIDEVRSAMQHQQVETYFQPKINLLTGDVVGVEALTRWNYPSGEIVPPAVFIPAIESSDLLNDLFFTLLNHGLELQRQAWSRGHLLNVAFNLESVQLSNPDLVSTIKNVLYGYGLPGSILTFELTESGLLEASATCLESLVRLRMMGCRLSIDDFGVGFSSLQRLCRLPFNEIKLNGQFVRGLDEPRCRATISSTLALGATLGMSVVVEGIETSEQYQQLLDLGCAQGQGFLFAKPMTRQDLLVWLETRIAPDAIVFT
ncbi:EAL domain-containing protein [Pseudomonas protegens]|uniref:EAL domain-containing response regulator n=1 Tax=Pseudomonas protegens TaxID=380021 RepID=UPI00382782CB